MAVWRQVPWDATRRFYFGSRVGGNSGLRFNIDTSDIKNVPTFSEMRLRGRLTDRLTPTRGGLSSVPMATEGSLLRLVIVLFTEDLLALRIVPVLDPGLFTRTYVAISTGFRFHSVRTGLALFQFGSFFIGERA